MYSLKSVMKKIGSTVGLKRNSSLVLLGGKTGTGEHADAIYKKIVELSGGENGKIAIITSASKPYDWDCKERGDSEVGGCNDPKAKNSKMVAKTYIERFKQYGIDAEWIPIDLANKRVANDSKWAQRIAEGEFTCFFFCGGKQDQYTELFYRSNADGEQVDSLILKEIRDQFRLGGIVIAGTSAGAVVQSSEIMIVRGKSNFAVLEGPQLKKEKYDRSTLQYLINGGFNLFDFGIIDSHFSQRGREGRAIRLASSTGCDMVYGIDEATALVVTKANKPHAKMEVIGQNGVQIFNLFRATTSMNELKLWLINDVHATYLTNGDQYLPKKEKVIFCSDKSNIRNNEVYRGELTPSENIFSTRKNGRSEFINTAFNLVNTYDQDTAYGYVPTKEFKYKVTFNKSEETQAYYIDEKGKRTISYTGLYVDFEPVMQDS
ncbi:cyanophycinase [Amphibacillus sp. MSJ-3]|uniref:cyanophycinase n=1 Tax=Amphibacillus sp. MSJ-3 TaxID=2841505 RepID=UPI001C0EE30E|nr:cyanophycinase [Amphibacillus sp. MSJ-3]MBU5594373.1 cyanophycinase [Amphibacillus sp. MSJ-3]